MPWDACNNAKEISSIGSPWAEKKCQNVGVNGIIAKTAELDHRHHFPFVSPLKIFIGEQNCFQIILYIILDTCED